MKILKLSVVKNFKFKKVLLTFFWFNIGFLFTAVALLGLVILYFQQAYKNRIIPGVYVDSFYIGGMTSDEMEAFFNKKNESISKSTYTFTNDEDTVTVSAKDLAIKYDTNLIKAQTLDLGKSQNVLSNMYIALMSYVNGVRLTTVYNPNQEKVEEIVKPLSEKINKDAKDALFKVENDRVTTFQESEDGQIVDYESLTQTVKKSAQKLIKEEKTQLVELTVPIKVLKPKVTTEEANEFGIVEKIGEGRSEFKGSIPNRIYNISLAASRVNGILVEPDEEFSFNKYLGDISRLTGYKEAYVIQNGRTVLGDGGGVCQVSTTLFRALLNAGVPITERHAHAYRVSYYEQNSPVGLDATIFYPRVDLKFKNDTGNHILIQSEFDGETQTLEYTLYGKGDGRTIEVSEPVVLSRTPAPEPLYQDDPNLPRGTTKQVDFAAGGAKVKFSRKITKDGKVALEETFTSSYAPWQAVFLVGIKDS